MKRKLINFLARLHIAKRREQADLVRDEKLIHVRLIDGSYLSVWPNPNYGVGDWFAVHYESKVDWNWLKSSWRINFCNGSIDEVMGWVQSVTFSATSLFTGIVCKDTYSSNDAVIREYKKYGVMISKTPGSYVAIVRQSQHLWSVSLVIRVFGYWIVHESDKNLSWTQCKLVAEKHFNTFELQHKK